MCASLSLGPPDARSTAQALHKLESTVREVQGELVICIDKKLLLSDDVIVFPHLFADVVDIQ